MGGSALSIETRRIESAPEFRQICNEVMEKLEFEVGVCGAVVPYYSTKSSFGDMDVLVIKDESFPANWTDKVVAAFSPKSTFKNGSCFSFDYKDFQVDLILAPQEECQYSYNYFAFNDLGNFVGRTAHRLGFKHGHDGFWYTIRDRDNPDYVVGEILVSRDYKEVMQFLGFPAMRGYFKTPEEIFEFAASSVYFDPRQFLLVNRSYAARVRDKKRKMYSGMLEWIKGRWPDLKEDEVPEPIDKQEHLLRAFKQFEGFQQAYDSAVEAHEQKKRLQEKFNGKFVSYCFHVPPQGKELGIIMKQLREKIEKYNLAQLIIDSDSAQCYNLFYNVLLLNDEYRKNDVLQAVQIKQVSS